MADKIEKALYGPSMTEVVCGALLGLLAGVVAASVYLVFKPVLTVRELPKEQPRGVVYFLPGLEGRARSSGWQAKQKQFLDGKSVQVVEDEINAWVGTVTPAVAAAPKPAKKEGGTAAPASNAIFTPSKPNFKIVNDKLQIGMTCTLNWYGLATDVVLQSIGTFAKEGDHFVYTPETVYLGSCPLHMLPGASGLLVSHVTNTEKISDEFRLAWNKLNDVGVGGGALKLVAAQ
jgi:hypothetical protein